MDKQKVKPKNGYALVPLNAIVMPLVVRYTTTERIYRSSSVYQNCSKDILLEPVRIIRIPCGTGAAASRYYYEADFPAPDDAEFVTGGLIRANINRKTNPKFTPKGIDFVGNIWEA